MVKATIALPDFTAKIASMFDEKLVSLPGGKVHLNLEENAEPAIGNPRTLPESIKTAVKAKLDCLEATSVIAKVNQPTVGKRSSTLRILH